MTVRRRRPKRDLPEYTAALEAGVEISCRDRPAEYVDYHVIPTEDEADELCIECPIMQLCLKNARWRHPAWGVWGGVAWINGKQVRNLDPAVVAELAA